MCPNTGDGIWNSSTYESTDIKELNTIQIALQCIKSESGKDPLGFLGFPKNVSAVSLNAFSPQAYKTNSLTGNADCSLFGVLLFHRSTVKCKIHFVAVKRQKNSREAHPFSAACFPDVPPSLTLSTEYTHQAQVSRWWCIYCLPSEDANRSSVWEYLECMLQ